jgi:hypothetical protein
MDENSTPPAEVPAPPVQTENPTSEVQAAPPPAAALVVHGEKSEREIELEQQLADTSGNLTKAERRALEAERRAAELERDNQELKKIPAAPKSKKERAWYMPVIGNEEN